MMQLICNRSITPFFLTFAPIRRKQKHGSSSFTANQHFRLPFKRNRRHNKGKMTTLQERNAEDQYEANNDANPPVSGDVADNSYKNRTGQVDQVPVVSDKVGQGEMDAKPPQNSDAQLRMLLRGHESSVQADDCVEQDEDEAIDKGNIISGRTRGAKPGVSYSEGPDENDLPAEVNQGGAGNSSTR
jgi:hypothetical protein